MNMDRNLMTRYWINAPSKHQPDNLSHGMLVIGPKCLRTSNADCTTVYPISGEAYSMMVYKNSLSAGWPVHLLSK